MLVSIIILTLNNWELTERCLESIHRHTSIPYEIFVVDNGSEDETVNKLRRRKDIYLIENKSNRGFAAGCNQGIASSAGDTLLLLNNDTLVSSAWLHNLTHALYSSQGIGIVGPVSNMVIPMQRREAPYANSEEYQTFALSFNKTNAGLWQDATALSGFCMLFRRELVDKIGYLDESYAGGGFEDIDFGYRTLKAGLRLVIAGDSYVHHEGNASFRSSSIDMEETGRRNRRIFVRKWNLNPERLIYSFDDRFFPAHVTARYCHHQPAFSSLPSGILIRNSHGNIYQIEKGEKRPVTSIETFYAFHFRGERVVTLPNSVVDALPQGRVLHHHFEFPGGFPEIFVAADSRQGIHLISHGVRYPFRDYESFCHLGFEMEEAVPLPDYHLESLTVGPPIDANVLEEHELMDYRLYIDPASGVYYAESGHLRPIPGYRELKAYGWEKVKPIPLPADGLSRYPQGPVISHFE